jgi:DNA-binding FrmR family transcriptional regulator
VGHKIQTRRSAWQLPSAPLLQDQPIPLGAGALQAAGSPEGDNCLPAVRRYYLGILIMIIENEKSKTQLVHRLKRIEGQLRGIQSMLNEERDCREIMQQLSAVQSAVRSTSRMFFQDYASVCLAQMDEKQNNQTESPMRVTREQMVQEMIALLDKTP